MYLPNLPLITHYPCMDQNQYMKAYLQRFPPTGETNFNEYIARADVSYQDYLKSRRIPTPPPAPVKKKEYTPRWVYFCRGTFVGGVMAVIIIYLLQTLLT